MIQIVQRSRPTVRVSLWKVELRKWVTTSWDNSFARGFVFRTTAVAGVLLQYQVWSGRENNTFSESWFQWQIELLLMCGNAETNEPHPGPVAHTPVNGRTCCVRIIGIFVSATTHGHCGSLSRFFSRRWKDFGVQTVVLLQAPADPPSTNRPKQ